jgi:hypothetical protein
VIDREMAVMRGFYRRILDFSLQRPLDSCWLEYRVETLDVSEQVSPGLGASTQHRLVEPGSLGPAPAVRPLLARLNDSGNTRR